MLASFAQIHTAERLRTLADDIRRAFAAIDGAIGVSASGYQLERAALGLGHVQRRGGNAQIERAADAMALLTDCSPIEVAALRLRYWAVTSRQHDCDERLGGRAGVLIGTRRAVPVATRDHQVAGPLGLTYRGAKDCLAAARAKVRARLERLEA